MYAIEQTRCPFVWCRRRRQSCGNRNVSVRGSGHNTTIIMAVVNPIISSGDLAVAYVTQRRQRARIDLCVSLGALGKRLSEVHVFAGRVKF